MAGSRFDVDPAVRALLRDLGIPPSRLLRRANLPTDLLNRGPAELGVEEYYRLWDALEVEGAGRDLAVEIGQAISVELFSPPIFAALCSPNLTDAARRLATYKPLIGPVRLDVEVTDRGLTIGYAWPPGATVPVLLAATELVFWVALARIATREPVRPVRVTGPRWPTDHQGLTDYFGTTVRRGERHSITFSPGDATRPFLTENDRMWRFFAPALRRRLEDLDESTTAAERVRAALHETLPAGGGTITAAAAHLATTPRTLQRQLSREGTTFQAVLSDTREQLARHYLNRDMRTSDIAYLLGYDDSNSFYRAFRSWTGSTPNAIRAASPR